MKSCPTCNRTFEDTFTFCLIDGAVLSAPFDPAKPSDQPTHEPSPPPTEVFRASIEPQTLPETRAASPPANLSPTITSPFQPQPIGQAYQRPARLQSAAAATKLPELARWLFIARGVAAILFGLLLLMWRVT